MLAACSILHAAQASVDQNGLCWEVLMAGDSLEIVTDTPEDSGQTHSFCLLPHMTRDQKSQITQESEYLACGEKYGPTSPFL